MALDRIGNQDVIVSGGGDDTARIWNPSGTMMMIVDLLGPVLAVAVNRDGALCTSVDRALCTFDTGSRVG